MGGFGAQRGREHAVKAQRLASDQASQLGNLGAVGSFWTQAIGAAGGNIDGFDSFIRQQQSIINQGASSFSYDGISGNLDQQEAVVRVGSQLLLRQLQQSNPNIRSLDEVPQFRQGYIQHLLDTIRVEGGGGTRPISNINEAGGFVTAANL